MQAAGGRGLDGRPQALGQHLGVGERRSREHHEELLAAEAVGEVEGAQLLAQRVGDVDEDRVAALVAVLVVDGLEVVEVGHDHADRLARERGLLVELRRAARPASGG